MTNANIEFANVALLLASNAIGELTDPSLLTHMSDQMGAVHTSMMEGKYDRFESRIAKNLARLEGEAGSKGDESASEFYARFSGAIRKKKMNLTMKSVVGGRILLFVKSAIEVDNYCKILGLSTSDLDQLQNCPHGLDIFHTTKIPLIFAFGLMAQNVREKIQRNVAVSSSEKKLADAAFDMLLKYDAFCEGVQFAQRKYRNIKSERKRGRRPKNETAIFMVNAEEVRGDSAD